MNPIIGSFFFQASSSSRVRYTHADVVIRYQGGDNAGHTVVNDKGKFALHIIPSGIFNPKTVNIVDAGAVVNFSTMEQELANLEAQRIDTHNLFIDTRAHLIMLVVRGITQVLGLGIPKGIDAAISGFAGIGHILLSVGLLTFLDMLRKTPAWEIALEKTQDIHVNSEKIARNEKIQEGRKLAAAFLNDEEKTVEEVQKQVKTYKGQDKELIMKGLVTALLDNISLPQTEGYKHGFQKVQELTMIIGDKKLSALVGQLGQFFDQYLAQIKQMTEKAKQQYQPRLEQKQEQLRAQYGDDIVLQPEQDPDFLKMLNQALKQLDAQYGQVITQAKEEIRNSYDLDQ